MTDRMNEARRTHYCGTLTAAEIGQKVDVYKRQAQGTGMVLENSDKLYDVLSEDTTMRY